MPSSNITLEIEDGYKAVTGKAISNVGKHRVEYLTDIETPDSSLIGHPLNPDEGIGSLELPAETIYFITRYSSAVLAVSE